MSSMQCHLQALAMYTDNTLYTISYTYQDGGLLKLSTEFWRQSYLSFVILLHLCDNNHNILREKTQKCYYMELNNIFKYICI